MDGSENTESAFEYAAYMTKRCEPEQSFIILVIEEFGRNIRTLEKHDSVVKVRSRTAMNYWKNTSQGSVASIYYSESHEGGRQCQRRNSKVS
jgi:hypothetical protein